MAAGEIVGARHELDVWIRRGVLAALAALLAVGVLLASRRAQAALTHELSFPATLAMAALVAGIVFGGRAVWRRATLGSAAPPDVVLDQFVGWSGSLAVVLAMAGCWSPTGAGAHWIVWAPLWIADQYLRHAFLAHRRTADAAAAPFAEPDAGGEEMLQQLVRVRGADGVECVRGTLSASFAAGQRHATLHVGFCPPLPGQPHVETEVLDAPDATAKVVQAFAHGARIEVRLAEPAEDACRVAIEFAASPREPR